MGVVASLQGASSRTHTRAGPGTPEQPPAPPFPLSAAAAFELALWYTRFGLDQLPDDPRCQHPAVRAHATAALTQHVAVQRMIGAQALPDRGSFEGTGSPTALGPPPST